MEVVLTSKYLKNPKKPLPKKEEPEVPVWCSACKAQLTRSPWNTKVDILYCDNYRCSKCRAPVGSVEIGYSSISDVIERLKNFTDEQEKRKRTEGDRLWVTSPINWQNLKEE